MRRLYSRTKNLPLPSKVDITSRAIDLLDGTDISPGKLCNLTQLGWVNKKHPQLFRRLDELQIEHSNDGVHHSLNKDWQPVWVIAGIDD